MSAVDVLSKIISIYADDTKVGAVKDQEDQQRLQDSLDRLYKWSVDWHLLFNLGKYKVMHLGGPKNRRFVYLMGGVRLEVTHEEKDVGVLVTEDLKPTAQCTD